MAVWPLESKTIKIPQKNEPGSFWENRGDRFHCGIDLYSKAGENIYAIEKGTVVEIGIMTSPQMLDYWNVTWYLIMKNENGSYWKYGEMGKINVKTGDSISQGERIGVVGLVLKSDQINENSPLYIQKLKYNNTSMLHLELFMDNPITKHEKYLGGNWFSSQKPDQLLDPTIVLKQLVSK